MRMTWCGLVAVAVLAAGCVGGVSRGENLTAALDGRRVERFDIEGDWLAYVWSGANTRSDPTRLAVRNLATGEERVLAEDWRYGAFVLDGGRVAYANGRDRDDDGRLPLRLYDIGTDETRTVATARVVDLDLAGDHLVYSRGSEMHAAVAHVDLTDGTARELTATAPDADVSDRWPVTNGERIVWVREDADGGRRLYAVDLPDGEPAPLPATPAQPRYPRIDGDFVVYLAGEGNDLSVAAYDFALNRERILVTTSHIRGRPALAGGIVAWAGHIPQREFRPVPGQPLIGAESFLDLYRYDLASGRRTQVASKIYRSGTPWLDVQDGRVYCTAEREVTPPRASNLVVPVDVRRF